MVLIFLKIILKTPVLNSHSFEVFVLNLTQRARTWVENVGGGGRFKRCIGFAQERGKWSVKSTIFLVFYFIFHKSECHKNIYKIPP